MKKVAFFMIAALLLGLCAVAFAQEFPDVPPDHWAYDAVQELVDYGIIQGYPDGTFGGKRAMTRYEFAEAVAKAVPVIAEMVSPGSSMPGGTGAIGPKGDKGDKGDKGEPGVGAEQLNTINRMMDEFQDELASLGVQVESVRRDLNALAERVTLVEEEQRRVRLTGDVNLIGRGTVQNSGNPIDRDGRFLPAGDNVLANSSIFTDLELGIAGRVSDDASVDALIAAGNYLPFALATGAIDDFTLWKLNLKAAMKLGPFGQGEVTVGRFPFQLTPLTLKFVDPDCYNYVEKLDSGDFILDGGSVMFDWSNIALTAFAAKTGPIASLITPTLLSSGFGAPISQLGGARAVIGLGNAGGLGVTYYQGAVPGFAPAGRLQVWGGDLNTTLGSLGLAGEYAKTDPDDALKNVLIPGSDATTDNTAWNAKLNFTAGNFGIGAGYGVVEHNFVAPGSWNRLGAVVNPVNVKGFNADLTYELTSSISLTAEGQFLEPDDDAQTVTARAALFQGRVLNVAAGLTDSVDYWRVGLKYGLTSASTVDLGWEQFTLSPVAAGDDTEERFISIGVGHTFNPNASMKLLYQIVDYEAGLIGPFADFRGGVASAQFAVKF